MREQLAVARSRWRERRDPAIRSRLAMVRRGLALPTSDELPTTSRGAVWAVGVVKNEADFLETSLRHMVGQGVDVILVADNGSDDGSVDIVRALRREGLPIVAATDREPEHQQGHKVTLLSHFARTHGAGWIIPFDADELWFARGLLVAEHLRASGADVVRADIHNVAPARLHARVGAAEGWVIGDHPAVLHKVAFRPHPFHRVFDGNHGVDRPGRTEPGLHIAHFPYRSRDQLLRKVRLGAAAVDGLPAHIAIHWRTLAALTDHEVTELWTQMVAGRYPVALGWAPEGQRRDADVIAWRTWQLTGDSGCQTPSA